MAPGILAKLTADKWQKLKEKLLGVSWEMGPCFGVMLMTIAKFIVIQIPKHYLI